MRSQLCCFPPIPLFQIQTPSPVTTVSRSNCINSALSDTFQKALPLRLFHIRQDLRSSIQRLSLPYTSIPIMEDPRKPAPSITTQTPFTNIPLEAEIPQVIHLLTQSPPSTQRKTLETYFTPSASFTHPFCRTGSFEGSRWLIWCIYRWYKIMSPKIEISVDSVGTSSQSSSPPKKKKKAMDTGKEAERSCDWKKGNFAHRNHNS